MTIGKRIAELRKSKGYTQEYIAEQLGVTRQAVSKWEQDITSPDTQNLITLAKLLDTSVEFLATGNSIQNQTETHKNHDLQRQKDLLEHKIVQREQLAYFLFLVAILSFFLSGGALMGLSILLLIAAIILFFHIKELKADLEFLGDDTN